MSVRFKGAGSFTFGAGSITPGYPTSNLAPVAGDIAILLVESENQAISLSSARGFVEIGDQNNKAAGTAATEPSSRLAVYWKRCVGGDTAPTVAASGDHNTACILLFDGVIRQGNPWANMAEGNDGGANSKSITFPSISFSTNDMALERSILFLMSLSTNSTSSSPVTTMTPTSPTKLLSVLVNRSNTINMGGGVCAMLGSLSDNSSPTQLSATLSVSGYKGAMVLDLLPEHRPTININYVGDNNKFNTAKPTLIFTVNDADPSTKVEALVSIHNDKDFGGLSINKVVKTAKDGVSSAIYSITGKDGLSLILGGSNTVYQHLFEDTSARPYNILTTRNTAMATLSTSAYGTTITCNAFSSDYLKFYILTTSNLRISQFSLATNSDTIDTATYDSKYFTFPTGTIAFWWKPDGTKIYAINNTTSILYQYSAGTAWDVSTLTLDKTKQLYTPSVPRSIVFNKEGTVMIFSDGSTNMKLHHHTLSTAWDIDTITKTGDWQSSELTAYCSIFTDNYQTFNPGYVNHILLVRTLEDTIRYELSNELYKLDSTVDAGFTNSLSETHPFSASTAITYHNLSLPSGRYYVDIRAKDTNGTNLYHDLNIYNSYFDIEIHSVTINASSSVSGNLGTKASSQMKVTIDGNSSVSAIGKLVVKGVININTSSSTSAKLNHRVKLFSNINPNTITSGFIKAKGKLIGIINPKTITSGFIKAKGKLIGVINNQSSTIPRLSSRAKLSGVINTVSSTNGLIKSRGKLVGVINPNTSLSLKIGFRKKILVTVSSITSALGLVKAKGKLALSINTISNVYAKLVAIGNVKTVVNSKSLSSGKLQANGRLSGLVSTKTSITGVIHIGINKIHISGIITPKSTTSGVTVGKGKLRVIANGISSAIASGFRKLVLKSVSNGATITNSVIYAKGKLHGVINNSSTTLVFGHLHRYAKANVLTRSNTNALLTSTGNIKVNVTSSSNTLLKITGRTVLGGIINNTSIVNGTILGSSKFNSQINAKTQVNGIITAIGSMHSIVNCNSNVNSIIRGNTKLKSINNCSSSVVAKISRLVLINSALNPSSQTTGRLAGKGNIGVNVNNKTTISLALVGKANLKGIITPKSDVSIFLSLLAYLSGEINTNSITTSILNGKLYLKSLVNSSTTLESLLSAIGRSKINITSITIVTGIMSAKMGMGVEIFTSSHVSGKLHVPLSIRHFYVDEIFLENSMMTVKISRKVEEIIIVEEKPTEIFLDNTDYKVIN